MKQFAALIADSHRAAGKERLFYRSTSTKAQLGKDSNPIASPMKR